MVEESTRAALGGILTHQFREKKEKKESKQSTPPEPPIVKIEEAFSLYFDGAYRKKEGKAAAGIVVFNPGSEKVMERCLVLPDVSSNSSTQRARMVCFK